MAFASQVACEIYSLLIPELGELAIWNSLVQNTACKSHLNENCATSQTYKPKLVHEPVQIQTGSWNLKTTNRDEPPFSQLMPILNSYAKKPRQVRVRCLKWLLISSSLEQCDPTGSVVLSVDSSLGMAWRQFLFLSFAEAVLKNTNNSSSSFQWPYLE